MRLYEVVYIFNPDLDEDAVNTKLEAFHALVTAADGAEVAAVDHRDRESGAVRPATLVRVRTDDARPKSLENAAVVLADGKRHAQGRLPLPMGDVRPNRCL